MPNSEFQQRIEVALADQPVRASVRRAMLGLRSKRAEQFPELGELERLRDQAARIRADALSRLPELLEQLETQCQANGIQVHWAESVEEANQIVLSILQRHHADRLIKGKSMVSEEMGLNDFLADQGIESLESDLGEFIVQLAEEPPSHIVAPAIHKNRQQVAALFKEKFPDIPYSEEIDTLTHNARIILRDKFYQAPVGLSGVNFAIAETGTLCLIENEGNGRMCTTIPKVHIAVTGIEKLIPSLTELPPLLRLLTRSATGQPITTYVNMISSPRKPGEKDGPEELHLLLLDNGRSRIYSDPELINTLRCIRCGACINHCPIYLRLGGHAYGTTIPGPIGSILEPQKGGLDKLGELPTASTLCGACGEVCPVRIPIPSLLNRLRFESVRSDRAGEVVGQGERRRRGEALLWKLWSNLYRNPALYRLFSRLATKLGGLAPKRFGAWGKLRHTPKVAPKSLHQLAKERGVHDE